MADCSTTGRRVQTPSKAGAHGKFSTPPFFVVACVPSVTQWSISEIHPVGCVTSLVYTSYTGNTGNPFGTENSSKKPRWNTRNAVSPSVYRRNIYGRAHRWFLCLTSKPMPYERSAVVAVVPAVESCWAVSCNKLLLPLGQIDQIDHDLDHLVPRLSL